MTETAVMLLVSFAIVMLYLMARHIDRVRYERAQREARAWRIYFALLREQGRAIMALHRAIDDGANAMAFDHVAFNARMAAMYDADERRCIDGM